MTRDLYDVMLFKNLLHLPTVATLRSLARRAVRKSGYELRRFEITSSERAQLVTALSHKKVNLVLDVGANTGGFGHYLRELGYRGRIVSFEPLRDAHRDLAAAAEADLLWDVAPRCAIGASFGEVQMHVSANSESSSILEMRGLHVEAHPNSVYVRSESVPLNTLDAVASKFIGDRDNVFVKIDTQGYEASVMEGAEATLERAVMVQVELSLSELYVGQASFQEMLEILRMRGFTLWGLAPVFGDHQTGRILQMDGLFVRE